MTAVRVVLVDDEHLTRAALRDYLSSDPGIEIVGEAADGQAAVTQAGSLKPHVVLMDMQMPGMNGVEATSIIRRKYPEVAVLGLTTFSSDRYVVDLLRAGASGYLVKDIQPKELIAAVHAVAKGDSVVAPAVARHVVAGLEQSKPIQREADPEVLSLLTDKEIEVIQLLARGMNTREMAEELFVTESTVKARFAKILEKLGARDRVQVLMIAIDRGIILPESYSTT